MNNTFLKSTKTLLKASIIGLYISSGTVLSQTLSLSPNLISFNSDEGEKLLIDSKSREDFFPLSMQFITQNNQAYCGIASIVMVLNGLQIPAPEAPQYKPYRVFTQENFFNNEATKKVLAPEIVSRQGMTLEQLGGLLASYGVKVNVYHAANTNLEQFRKLAAENLKQPKNFVLINYLRKEIGQEKGGHISPLAAYNEQTDRFLIMDVSRYKYPPVWVKTTDLWKAMATTDSDSGKTRGFVFVSKGS
ncbi:glutathione gamma-glutamylcysteinyltransferase [Komarekiella sp. 'clone 1']|uniref:glutathione gamma-glutamylcysteinyltransferase n=1 Tax=Komarekiella delphini-convector SJRDD-AB1 TaxID=2593771 RepID=A0AA40SYN4_9NOST|nr:phytochelatin synthase family protein [Komarekiella delphini-convector]MBD6617733.1 glutathione gamma-glutamylcysteinyltransferase [Komarekiella delphini-convector SJRDD-AB1]